jgi:transposase InsO family protein
MSEKHSPSTEEQDNVALFRYSLISPVVSGTLVDESNAAYFRRVSGSELDVPGRGSTKLSPSTLKSWLGAYRAGGFDALRPKPRCDLGDSRVISEQVEERLRELLRDKPKLSATKAREILVDEELITSNSPSVSSIRRFIRSKALRVQGTGKSRERRAWAKREPNELWTLDFKHGPTIGKTKTLLLAIMDDASRFIVLAAVLLSESYAELAPRLLKAFSQHGLPKALYCDNGAAFSCRDLSLACARLGIALIHSKPYDPESRGKIERFFLTVTKRFLDPLDPAHLASIEAFGLAFTSWVDSDYHRHVHSSLGTTPLARFLDTATPRQWVTQQQLDLVFHRTIHRKVRKDCTVSINGQRYEVGAEWIGHKVEIRSPLNEPDTFILFADGEPALNLKPLDLIENDRRNTRARFADHKQENDS